MRYVGDLIVDSRTDTNNSDYSATNGIQDADFLRYLNYGQENLQSIILRKAPNTFQSQQTISIVANQEAYQIQDNVYFGERIVNVEYSLDGSALNYRKLRALSISERNDYPQAHPNGYIRRSGEILLRPPRNVSQGTLRVTYERQLDKLDVRRAQVNGTPSTSLIDLNSATFGSPSAENEALFVYQQYICLCDFYGNPILYNGVISSYNPGTNILTLDFNVVTYLVAGKTLADCNEAYLTLGKWTNTHSQLKDPCERYLIAYSNWKILGRDAATMEKSKSFKDELNLILTDISDAYEEADKDEHEIQVTDRQLMLQEY